MLIFNLKKEWFEKIKSGEKRFEYRELKPYWTTRIFNEIARCSTNGQRYLECLFVNAYNYSDTLKGHIRLIDKLESGINTDLKTDKPVYVLAFDIMKEGTNGK